MKLRWMLMPAVLFIWSAALLSQTLGLLVERCGERLCISSPQMHFLQGRALEKLRNGSTEAYVLTLRVHTGNSRRPVLTLRERFLVSFDLWEEKFSVVQEGRHGRSVSRLSAGMAEAWCMEGMPVPAHAIPDGQSFMIKLECSIDESGTESGNKVSSTLTLSGLIDIFSRKDTLAPPRWEASAGPLRLSDVKSVKQAQ